VQAVVDRQIFSDARAIYSTYVKLGCMESEVLRRTYTVFGEPTVGKVKGSLSHTKRNMMAETFTMG
jgi:hypothetical protein